MTRREQAFRAVWMEKFEAEVIKLEPGLRGRIVWDEVLHHYFQKRSPEDAATKYVGTL